MKLTKYEHACFTVEKDGQILVVDPGNLSTDFIAPEGVVGIVITHEHADHFDHEQLAAIMDKNPDAVIIAHSKITDQIEVFQTRSVAAGDTFTVGEFSLEFFGGLHALIHPSIPQIANLGVMIDELIYYPGDSFTLPEKSVDVLAIPANAPWMKIGESMDFMTAVGPRLVFPTHDAFLSDRGDGLVDRILGATAQSIGATYQRIDDSIEV